MALVGITGGIGAGKSTVLDVFQKLGAATLDADSLVHQLYARGGEGTALLDAHWGPQVLAADGSVDRKVVASIVFTDATERQWLNQAIHPLVQAQVLAAAERCREPLFCAVPLLFESGWQELFNCIITVWCSAQQQRERLRQRGWSEQEIAARLAAQADMNEKAERADYVLLNTGTVPFLTEQCRQLKLVCARQCPR